MDKAVTVPIINKVRTLKAWYLIPNYKRIKSPSQ